MFGIYGLIILSCGLTFADSWHIQTIDSNDIVGDYNSIAVDSAHNPHISYYDQTNLDLKYAYWDGSAWNISSVDTNGDVGLNTSLALDSSDHPHISYYDVTNLDLKYAYWDGSVWDISSVDTSGDVGSSLSLVLDSSDHPYIAYYDATNGDLKYAYWDGSSWDISSMDTDGDVGGDCSIAMDIYGYPCFSYYDYTNGDLKFAYWDGYEWVIFTIDSAGNVGLFTSLAVDAENIWHIAYYDYTCQFLKHATTYSGPWTISSIAPVGEFGGFPSIAIGQHEYPHISYYDRVTHNLYHAHWDYTTWEIHQINPYGSPVEVFSSIFVDQVTSLFIPHVSYADETNYDLMYAWYGPDVAITLEYFNAQNEDGAVSLEWSIETTEGEQIAGFNLYRRPLSIDSENTYHLLTESNNQLWEQVNDHLICGENPYEYTDADVDGGTTYEYRLEAVLADDSAQTLGTTQTTTAQPTTFAILSLYPNPTTETMTCLLSVPSAGQVELTLYDLSGRIVQEERINADETTELSVQFDVSSLASGVYVLHATLNGAEANARFVIAR